jgi:hypothetical protein
MRHQGTGDDEPIIYYGRSSLPANMPPGGTEPPEDGTAHDGTIEDGTPHGGTESPDETPEPRAEDDESGHAPSPAGDGLYASGSHHEAASGYAFAPRAEGVPTGAAERNPPPSATYGSGGPASDQWAIDDAAAERARLGASQETYPSGDEPTQLMATGVAPAPEPPMPVEFLPEPPDGADTVRGLMRKTKRGPLRRLVLYASGVDTRVLWYAPIEESEYVVQGSLVLLTSIVAAVSALAASSFLTAGKFVLNPLTVLIGLAWGLLIFFFDRALVSGTFNPYHFSKAEVKAMRERGIDAPWAHLIADELPRKERFRRKAAEVVRVGLVASLRIALALATSYIAAEMVLFLVFQPEVNARTAYLQQQLQAQRIATIQSDFAAQSAQRADQRKQLSGASDPDITRLTTQVTTLTTQLDAARKDLGILQAAAAAELDGDKYQATLSDGTVVKTTGKRGNGAAAQSLAQRRDTQQAAVNDLSTRLTRARSGLDAKQAAIEKTNATALSTLDQLDNKATQDEQAALAAAVTDPTAVNGLLIRQAALNMLEYDENPETVAPDPVPACHGLFGWWCSFTHWLIPPTPMGPAVVAYRVIFFVIEILPITYKVISSLRRRRPYDVAKAALEEASNLEALRLLDRHLHDTAKELTHRAQLRHGPRPQPGVVARNGHPAVFYGADDEHQRRE